MSNNNVNSRSVDYSNNNTPINQSKRTPLAGQNNRVNTSHFNSVQNLGGNRLNKYIGNETESSYQDLPLYNRPEKTGITVDLISQMKHYDTAKTLASEEYNRNKHRGKQNVVNVINTDLNLIPG